jgi:excisionase family DNA binding protein
VNGTLYTVADVARLTGLHPGSIYRMIYNDTLKAVRIGKARTNGRRAVRITESALEALIEQHQGGVHRPRAGRK